MKKRILTGSLMLAMIFSISSLTMAGDMPGPDGDALWHYIFKVSPYTGWDYWPDHKGMQEGRAPTPPCTRFLSTNRPWNQPQLP